MARLIVQCLATGSHFLPILGADVSTTFKAIIAFSRKKVASPLLAGQLAGVLKDSEHEVL